MSDLLAFVSANARDTLVDTTAASACLDRFTAAFNAGDLVGMDAELHFPHTLLSGAQRLVWDGPGRHPPDFFEQLRASGWAYTRYESKEAVLASADKVHFVLTYTRRNAADEVLSTHHNLWIATRLDGRWGIVLRSY
jgi:hypothetical protein